MTDKDDIIDLISQLNEYVNEISGGYVLYLQQDASADIGGYLLMCHEDPDDAKTDVGPFTITADDQELEQWATAVGCPGITLLQHGNYEVHLHAEKTAGIKNAILYFEFYKRAAAGAETLLGTSELSRVIPGAEEGVDIHMHLEELILLATDRLVIKLYGNQSGFGTDPTISVYVEGVTIARFSVPVSIGDIGVGAGEANTGSNVGADGLGVFKQKAGVDLEFKHIAPASAKITVAANGDDIDLDVAEAQLSLANLGVRTHASLSDAPANAHHIPTVAGDLLHNSLAGLNAGDVYEHISAAQLAALHATYTNAEAVAAIEAAGLALDNAQVITSQDADLAFLLGRVEIGSLGFADLAGIGHRDPGANSYALLQHADGTTYLNAANTKTLYHRINNVTIMNMTAAGLQIGAGERVDVIRDEDNMVSDDVNALATQQSIKKYVDDEVAGAGGGGSHGVIVPYMYLALGATQGTNRIILNAVNEQIAVNFYIDNEMDAGSDMKITWVYKRGDAGGDTITFKLYVGATKTDGTETNSFNIENATAIQLPACALDDFQKYQYTLANAGIEQGDEVNVYFRHNEAGKTIEVESCQVQYKHE